MSFIPYCSSKGTVDLAEADKSFCEALELTRQKMRRLTTRWVPSLQYIAERRPEMHWCAYSDGRVVAFIDLERGETFGDLQDIYDFIGQQVRHLKSLGNYQGDFIDEPDPEDDTEIRWRQWKWKAGDSSFELTCGFAFSGHCQIIVEGIETITVEKKRVVCDGGPSIAMPEYEISF